MVNGAHQQPKTQLPGVGKSIGMIVVFMLVSYGVGLLVGFVYGAYLGITAPKGLPMTRRWIKPSKHSYFRPPGFSGCFSFSR